MCLLTVTHRLNELSVNFVNFFVYCGNYNRTLTWKECHWQSPFFTSSLDGLFSLTSEAPINKSDFQTWFEFFSICHLSTLMVPMWNNRQSSRAHQNRLTQETNFFAMIWRHGRGFVNDIRRRSPESQVLTVESHSKEPIYHTLTRNRAFCSPKPEYCEFVRIPFNVISTYFFSQEQFPQRNRQWLYQTTMTTLNHRRFHISWEFQRWPWQQAQ